MRRKSGFGIRLGLNNPPTWSVLSSLGAGQTTRGQHPTRDGQETAAWFLFVSCTRHILIQLLFGRRVRHHRLELQNYSNRASEFLAGSQRLTSQFCPLALIRFTTQILAWANIKRKSIKRASGY